MLVMYFVMGGQHVITKFVLQTLAIRLKIKPSMSIFSSNQKDESRSYEVNTKQTSKQTKAAKLLT